MTSKDGYATHLPTLKKVLEENDIKVVVEDGGGSHSTSLFLKSNVVRVFTVEEDESWYSSLKAIHEKNTKWILFSHWDSDFWQSNPDLVFIDGKAETRAERANDAFRKKVPFVVIHDTEESLESFYHMSRLEPVGYKVVHFINAENPKRTSLYTYDPS